MDYRYDLDCLRGIAMLLVFIYHFNKSILPSGYIGVDVFFILSGFVITASNMKNINWIEFYVKRIVRLYPQQLLCLLVVFIITYIQRLINYELEIDNILSSLLGYSNYHFYFISVDYFQSIDSPSTVLHFWSLSVENQFYLFYPILLFFIQYIKFYIILYISSIAVCMYESIYYEKFAYFALSSRINEFMLGSILSLPFTEYYLTNSNFINSNFMMIGIVFLSLINREWTKISFPFPFLLAIQPIISYLIVNNEKQNHVLNSILLNFLGKISYSYYLFHYPLLSYTSNRDIKCFLCISITTCIISVFSTYVLEKPLRSSKYKSAISIIIVILIIFFSLMMIKSKSYYKRYISHLFHNSKYNSSYMIQSPSDANYNWECNLYSKMCWCPFFKNKNEHNEKYILDNIYNKEVLFLIGDSHIEQWLYLVQPYANKMKYTLLELYCNVDCIALGEYDWIFRILAKFKNKHYAIVSNYLNRDISQSFEKYVNELIKMFQLIYIIQDTPHYADNPNNCLIKNVNRCLCYGILKINATIIKYPIINNKKLYYMDLNEFICREGKCPFMYKGYPVYRDFHHLNLNFTYFLKKIFFMKGFKLEKANNSSNSICDTTIWCRKDVNQDHFSYCKGKLIRV